MVFPAQERLKRGLPLRRRRRGGFYTDHVGDWYTIGLAVGVGTGIGVLLGGALVGRFARIAAIVLGAVAGAVVGILVDSWDEAAGGGIGGALGAIGAAVLARGTLRRGGTRGGTAALFAAGGVVVAALGLVPVLGYVEAVAVPALAARIRRRGGDRYAGLRILAKD